MFVKADVRNSALIPLFLGRAIDALLDHMGLAALIELGVLFVTLTAVGVGRRAYDTRAYGTMRVRIGAEFVERSQQHPVSQLTARLTMSREIVDFLEEHTPNLISSIIQVIVSIVILFSFDARLGYEAVAAVVAMGIAYGLFHNRFFRLNASLNEIAEGQVAALETRDKSVVVGLLQKQRGREVSVSDTNSVLYGVVFLAMFALILSNLWFASLVPAVTAGAVFSILTYSWELVGSSIELPEVLQQWTRLSEIQSRINTTECAI